MYIAVKEELHKRCYEDINISSDIKDADNTMHYNSKNTVDHWL